MTRSVVAAVAAILAVIGGYLIYSATGGASDDESSAGRPRRSAGDRFRNWAQQSGLGAVRPVELVSAMIGLFVVGGAAAYAMFDGVLPAVGVGTAVSTSPLASYRARRRSRLARAAEAWPRVLEELRLQIGSLGRSVPQGLFEAGGRVPEEWRSAFDAAEREWMLTTDFPRTVAILKDRLADPTADAVCETLLVAHEVGGSDVDGRLADLIEDRILDLQGRKDAVSRQAGLRFARRFVLIVPVGMALAGLAIGTGRSAYESPGGQIAVVAAVVAVAACWLWSARLMRLPEEPRVFQ